MGLNKEAVLKALSKVEDPDFKQDIVSLDMVQDIVIEDHKVSFTLVLTTPACPLKEQFKQDCLKALQGLDPEVSMDLNFSSQVTTQRRANQEMMDGIKNIILVSSGKGGVGKSTISTNLAVGLGKLGAKVGLLDADIHGPSIPNLLDATDEKPGMTQEGTKYKLIPLTRFGISVLSMGMLVDEKQPLIFRGPMQASALKQLMLDVDWGELDYLIIDTPPGTGDIHLSLAQQFPVTATLIVTTPQNISIADTKKSVEMYRSPQTRIPILGIVENMSWFTPEEHPEERYYLFGSNGGKALSEAYELPLLAQVPLIAGMDQQADKGIPAVVNRNPLLSEPFMEMCQRVAQQIALVNLREPELETVN